MSDAYESLEDLPTVAWVKLRKAMDRFEEAWNQGGPVEIAEFLPGDDGRLSVLRALIHIDLERRLDADETVRLERYLDQFPELKGDDENLLELVAAEFFLRRRRDARVAVQEFEERFPHLQNRLADQLADGRADAPTEADRGSRSLNADETETESWLDTRGRPADVPEIPEYEISKLIGQGGMGMVLQGRHRVLDRRVAIKLPHPRYVADPEGRERFLREARSTARLRHPNICPVYEVGQVEGRPYIVMDFIQGPALRELIQREKLTGHQAAALVAKLARSVGYAHDHGVIHRDIKPANVIVEEESREPVLTDFGLAKELSDDASLMTQEGQVMGTPAYMAPEQAAGHVGQIGPLSDVYALGAVLYELLCGKPPFVGPTGEVLRRVQMEEPTAPRKLLPRLHRDLETICRKAMAKRPADRYASAVDLAEDLDRFCAGEAILARRESSVRWALRRMRRHPVTAAMIGLSLVGLLIACGIVWRAAHASRRLVTVREQLSARLQQMNNDAPQEVLDGLPDIDGVLAQLTTLSPDEGTSAEREIQRALVRYIETIANRPRISDEDIPVLRQLVSHLVERGSGETQRLRGQLDRVQRGWLALEPLSGPPGTLMGLLPSDEFSLAGDTVERTSKGGEGKTIPSVVLPVPCSPNVRIEASFAPPWASVGEVGLMLGAVDGHAKDVVGLAFSPDGTVLASGSSGRGVKVWDVGKAELIATFDTSKGAKQLAFSSDGQVLAVHCWSSEQTIWNVETHGLMDKRRATTPLGLSPNRQQIASAFDRQIVVQRLDSGEVVQQFDYPDARLQFVELIDDGDTMVTVDDQGIAKVWNWREPAVRRVLRDSGDTVMCFAASPESRRVAVGTESGTLQVWDVDSGELVREFVQNEPVHSVRFAPGGASLAANVRFWGFHWDTATGRALAKCRPSVWSFTGWEFSSDGRQLLGADGDHLTRWAADSGKRIGDSAGHLAQIRTLAVDPSGRRVATGGRDGLVEVWDEQTGRLQQTLGVTDYAVSLRPTPQEGPVPEAELSIRRGGIVVADTELAVPSSSAELPLRLSVERLNGRIRVWVNATSDNEAATLDFDEVFRTETQAHGSLGVIWPPGLRLAGLSAFRRKDAESASLWDFAEKYFSQGRYELAHEQYHALAARLENEGAVEAADLWQEAKYKEALSLQVLGRTENAEAIYQELRGLSGRRWPVYATAQLWSLRMIEGDSPGADSLLKELEEKQVNFRQIAAVIRDETRSRLLEFGRKKLETVESWYSYDPARVANLRHTVVVEELLFGRPRAQTALKLIRALRLAGDLEAALDVADRLIDEPFPSDDYVDEYAWMLREAGRLEEAAAFLDRFLERDEDGYDPAYARLLTERALVEIQRGDRDGALATIDEVLQLPEGYGVRGHLAHLVKGFLLEDLGKTDESREAWRDGFQSLPGVRDGRGPRLSTDWLFYLILGSLSGDLSGDELDENLNRVLADLTGGSALNQLLGLVASGGQRAKLIAALQQAWHTPRGRRLARDIAYQQIPFPQFVRDPPLLLATQVFAQQIRPEGLSEDEEELLWQVAQDLYDLLFVEGKIGSVELGSVLLGWKMQLWPVVKQQLEPFPRIRGPFAYFLGVRLARKPNAEQAADCFQTAVADAGDNARLKRLAEQQLK